WNEQRLYCEILKNSQRYAQKGRMETGYSYKVPNQWQGNYKNLKVIGDKQGGASTVRIGKSPQIVDLLFKVIQKQIKFIHVTRNPYDNISSIFKRDGKRLGLDFQGCIDHYFSHCGTIANFKQQIKEKDFYDLKHEDIIQNPKIQLKELCDFLGQETSEDYLEDCASIIFDSPNKSRSRYDWDKDMIQLVESQIQHFSFLEGYSYEN
ncbi:MAG: sulfotransferase, partial [Crocosphaera sp.]